MAGSLVLSTFIGPQAGYSIPLNFKSVLIEDASVYNSNLWSPEVTAKDGFITLRFNQSSLDFVLISIGFSLFAAIWTFILYQFKQIFQNFRNGFLFVESNLKRIRIIAYVIIAAPILKWVLYFPLHRIILNHITLEKVELTNPFNYYLLVTGLFILAMVEIFRVGIKLEEEQEYMV